MSTLIGVSAVLVVIGSSVNVCLGLWTRSTVEAVAEDAARDLAATPGEIDDARIQDVLDRARRRLGPVAARSVLVVEDVDGAVRLHVRFPGVSLLPRMLRQVAVGTIDERVVVRREGTT